MGNKANKQLLWSFLGLMAAAAPAMAVDISPAVRTVVGGAWVQLNAHVNGVDDGCRYVWTQIEGPAAVDPGFGNAGIRHLDLTAPFVDVDSRMKFQVAVSECANAEKNGAATAIVNIIAGKGNIAPIASAVVTPSEVFEGMTVSLDGSDSTDPNNDALTYQWEQVAGPTVALSGANTAVATFIAPNNSSATTGSTLQFKLTVSDGTLSHSTYQVVNVKWVNDPPKAALACPKTVDERATFHLDGAGSTDSDDGIAGFAWRQTYGGPYIAGLSANGPSAIDLAAPTLTSKFDTMTFELRATDNSGAFDTATCDVKVRDITPPVLSNVPMNLVVEAQSASGATVNFNLPKALDAVDGDRPVVCDHASGTIFPIDVATTVKCGAADESGNTADASFTVSVRDTTPPKFTAPINVTALATSATGASVSYAVPTAQDLVDGYFPASCSPSSGSAFQLGANRVICNASDKHGNAAVSQSFAIAVNYGFKGLFAPYDPAKAHQINSAIPLKWQYTTANGAPVASNGAQPNVVIYKVVNGVEAAAPIQSNCAGASGYQYETGSSTWQYNWKTTGLTAGPYNIYIRSELTGQVNGPFPIQLRQ